MEKVDRLIEEMTESIRGMIKSNIYSPQSISEGTKALAELIAARALMN